MVIEYTPHAAQMEIHRARGFRFRPTHTDGRGQPRPRRAVPAPAG